MDIRRVYNAVARCLKLCLYGVADHDHVLCVVGGAVVEVRVVFVADVWLEALGRVRVVDEHLRLVGVRDGEIRQAAALRDELVI